MIEEISFKNILSFKNEATLSFEALGNTDLENAHVRVMPNGTRLLRLGVIYGSNASGKSNVLKAIEALHNFWFSEPQNMDAMTMAKPFLLDSTSSKAPSVFDMKFWVDGIRYWYQLTMSRNRVLYEKLSYYKTIKPITVFERQLEDEQSVVHYNSNVQKISSEEQKALLLHCLPNMSFMAARGHVNMKMLHVDAVRAWMRRFVPVIAPERNLSDYSREMLEENMDFRRYILDFLGQADFNITDMRVKTDVIGFEHTVTGDDGEEHYLLGMEDQSAGTNRVLGVEAAVYEAIRRNTLLMIDEMEASLHPELMEYVIQQFLRADSNSQLLLTTHYDGLLRQIDDLIRKDNVWFVEKDKSGISNLYSLTDFKGLSRMSPNSICNAYRHGQFGAHPNI
ncbi:MAG: ATP-binding protein [Bacteroidaceae bacterium]|nr:ATP-binding protein [Bacteroidaceae bacterium]